MHFTDRELRVLSSKNNPTDQEKRIEIKRLDLQVWEGFAPKVKAHKNSPSSYWCYCPYCEKGRKQGAHNITGLVYEHPNGDGLGFSCVACGAKHPRVYEFLGKGSAAAEEYAWKRFEIDAVGKGWYCPHPQRWKQEQQQAKRERAIRYKIEYDKKKIENKSLHALNNGIKKDGTRQDMPPDLLFPDNKRRTEET